MCVCVSVFNRLSVPLSVFHDEESSLSVFPSAELPSTSQVCVCVCVFVIHKHVCWDVNTFSDEVNTAELPSTSQVHWSANFCYFPSL